MGEGANVYEDRGNRERNVVKRAVGEEFMMMKLILAY